MGVQKLNGVMEKEELYELSKRADELAQAAEESEEQVVWAELADAADRAAALMEGV